MAGAKSVLSDLINCCSWNPARLLPQAGNGSPASILASRSRSCSDLQPRPGQRRGCRGRRTMGLAMSSALSRQERLTKNSGERSLPNFRSRILLSCFYCRYKKTGAR